MFQYTIGHWATFLAAAVLLNVSPGPDMAFILGNTIRGGKRSGFAALFGIWSGTFIHVLMAAAGLSAILSASVFAFSAVKWVGGRLPGMAWLPGPALRRRGKLDRGGGRPTDHRPPLSTGGAGVTSQSQGSDLFPCVPSPVRRERRRPCLGAITVARKPDHRRGSLHRAAPHSPRR
ncbi:LysE type translocator [Rhizobium sp. ERR 1071]|nr:LysE type translocator [Rhizobium sp. ERR1071]